MLPLGVIKAVSVFSCGSSEGDERDSKIQRPDLILSDAQEHQGFEILHQPTVTCLCL